jgi:hypothetical protein
MAGCVTFLAMRTCLARLLSGLLALGCGGPPPITPMDAGTDLPPMHLGTADNIVCFEGQQAFVTVIHSPIDVSDASVALPAEFEEVEHLCVGQDCAFVLRVLDMTPNTGMRAPPPIDALRRAITLTTDEGRVQAMFNVMPLDRMDVSGQTTVHGAYFASSAEIFEGTTLAGPAGGTPPRFLIFGNASFHATVDVSASGEEPGTGGLPGGAIGSAADGQGAGGLGSGGGSAEIGVDGAEGVGGPVWALGCEADFYADECGGGGGGGDATEPGGGGGGSFALVALGTLSLNGEIRARGGDGGGGGGGGRVFFAGREAQVQASIDVAGGEGTAGSDGGGGTARIEPTLLMPEHLVVSEGAFSLTVSGMGGTALRVSDLDGNVLATAPVVSGTATAELDLPAGLSRLRLEEVDGANSRRLFVGNHVELERRDTRTLPLPIGGLLDLVYLPAP